MNQANELHLLPPPPSPTISSVSSSDLDTESTGSFFHDRSTTLGTLMGVSFPSITFRVPSQHRDDGLSAAAPSAAAGDARRRRNRKKIRVPAANMVAERRRRWWWSLCGDEEARPGSLGEFLEVERRFGDGAFFAGAAEMGGVVAAQPRDRRLLFADGRVLPPPAAEGDGGTPTVAAACRFPVSLGGICSGGAG